jgi:hypothetical protein
VPSVDEPVGRLEGIGEQAVSTLKALGQQLEDTSRLPAHLAVVEKVRFGWVVFLCLSCCYGSCYIYGIELLSLRRDIHPALAAGCLQTFQYFEM